MKLFDELRRRNVFKVTAAYLAACWLVVQAAATIGPMFDLPASAGRIVVWIGLVGLPIVVALSWAYELTPDGVKRTSDVAAEASIARDTGRRLNRAIIGLLLLVIALLVSDRLLRGTPVAPSAPGAAAPTADDGTKAAATSPNATPSIAVLPFVDMSQAKDQEYFADGLSEELLNLLAKLPQLRVIARTSSFSFKNKDTDVATIASRLGVDHVLEGSVRKSGDMVRITAQLIRASDSTHVWSDSYDRKLTEVFAIQDEIAAAVVEALKVQLLPDQALTDRHRPANTEAYNQYLLGSQYMRDMSTENYVRAVAALRRAIELDPGFAQAYADLSNAELYAADYTGSTSGLDAGRQRARDAAERAIVLAPDLADGYARRGLVRMVADWDWEGARTDLDRALALDPNRSSVQMLQVRLLTTLGHFDEAATALRQHLDRDPMDANSWAELAHAEIAAGNLGAARQAAERAVSLNADSDLTQGALSNVALVQGKPQESIDASRGNSAYWRAYSYALAYYTLGDVAASDRALAELKAQGAELAAFQIANVYAWRGQKDEAFRWLDTACRMRDGGLAQLQSTPFLAPIRDDPRYAALLRKLNLPE